MIFDEIYDFSIKVEELKQDIFVYLLLKNQEVVYVGQTIKGISRPLNHIGKKSFDEIKIFYCDEFNIGIIENNFILKYKPKYNLSRKIHNRKNKVKEIENLGLLNIKSIQKMYQLKYEDIKEMINSGLKRYCVGKNIFIEHLDFIKFIKTEGKIPFFEEVEINTFIKGGGEIERISITDKK